MPFFTQHRLVLQCLYGAALGVLMATTPAWCQLPTAGALLPPIASAPQPDKAVHRTVLAHAGSDQVLVVDNATLNIVGRLGLRTTLRIAPALSPDGRYAFFIGEGNWISRFDLRTLRMMAEQQLDYHIHHAAISGDGQYLAIADDDARTLTVLDANFSVLKQQPITSRDGQRSSRAQSIHTAPARQSFVVALRDLPEIWEISYNPTAPEIPMGVIHDFQYREGAFAPGFLNPMRTTLATPVADSALGKDGNALIVTTPEGNETTLVHLDVRRPIARWTQTEKLHWSAGYAWDLRGQTVLAAPTQDGRSVMVRSVEDGHTVRNIPTPGRPYRIEGHASASHLWVVTEGPANTLTIIDKQTLDVVGQHAFPTGASIETLVLSGNGQRVFAGDAAGTVRVFDEQSRREIKRLDLRNPSTRSGRLPAH